MFEVNKTKMQEGLEESIKHQLNLIEEAITRNLVHQQAGRIEDYQTLRKKAEATGVNTTWYDEKYNEMVAQLKIKV